MIFPNELWCLSGVTRSDCTYDVVHIWRGRFYRLDEPG